MTKTLRFHRQRQDAFYKLFSQLCGAHSAWEVWADFVSMSAISIANAFDQKGVVHDNRERQYQERPRRYPKDEWEVFPKLLATVVLALEEDPQQDFLGEMFSALELHNHWKGQFFTPYPSRVLHLAFIYKVLHGDASAPAGLEDSNIRDYPSDNHELDPEDNAPDTSPKPDNMASVRSPEDTDSDGASDDTDSMIPDETNSDEQNPAVVEDAVDSEQPASASNPKPTPTDASETEEALPEEEASIPDANSRLEEVLPLQDGLDSGDCPPDNGELEPEKHIFDISHESDNMADLKFPEDADFRGTPDSTDSVPPDPSNPDEQNSDNENTVDSEQPASTSNPNAAPTDASETEETFPVGNFYSRR